PSEGADVPASRVAQRPGEGGGRGSGDVPDPQRRLPEVAGGGGLGLSAAGARGAQLAAGRLPSVDRRGGRRDRLGGQAAHAPGGLLRRRELSGRRASAAAVRREVT